MKTQTLGISPANSKTKEKRSNKIKFQLLPIILEPNLLVVSCFCRVGNAFLLRQCGGIDDGSDGCSTQESSDGGDGNGLHLAMLLLEISISKKR